jgi:Uma2 family endonuclease
VVNKVLTTPYGPVEIPQGVVDHRSFLKWLRSGEVSEEVRVGFINGAPWVETMPERAFAHNKIKVLLARVLDGLVVENKLGVYFGDGMTFTSESSEFTSVPDGIFVSQETIDAGRVQLVGGAKSRQDTELVGTPDLVIEVVSPTSVDKDTEWLMSKYHDAGITEYSVIDARDEPLRFWIYRHRPKGYVAARRIGGWTPSAVLGRAFRFVPGELQMGHRTYRFEVR